MWSEFDRNFGQMSWKPSDFNFFKIFLIEKDFDEYLKQNIDVIDNIMMRYYEVYLRTNATKGFLKWCKNKVSKERVNPKGKEI
jgi:hypothetical protein